MKAFSATWSMQNVFKMSNQTYFNLKYISCKVPTAFVLGAEIFVAIMTYEARLLLHTLIFIDFKTPWQGLRGQELGYLHRILTRISVFEDILEIIFSKL